MPTNAHINQYKDLCASKGGPGLAAVSYSLSRGVKNVYGPGQRKAIATYGELPTIELSISSYSGSFSVEEANSLSSVSISGKGGSTSVDKAVLSGFSFDLSVDSPLIVTKTYSGFAKSSSSGGGGGCADQPSIVKRQDFGGSIPAEIAGNHLQRVSGRVSIGRQFINEFATRRPYASVVTFPIERSITFEAYTNNMDSVIIEDMERACKNQQSATSDVGVSACGFSFNITKAYITSLEYSGGDASSPGDFQTVSITYTSYEDILGLKPIILMDQV
jgi:hypothetical protein